MNAAERQALREKHRQDDSYCFACAYWNEKVGDFHLAAYPCDVIKVLDATEPADTEIRASATSDVLPVNKCIHPTNGKAFRWGYKPVITKFYYCPMCGEKL